MLRTFDFRGRAAVRGQPKPYNFTANVRQQPLECRDAGLQRPRPIAVELRRVVPEQVISDFVCHNHGGRCGGDVVLCSSVVRKEEEGGRDGGREGGRERQRDTETHIDGPPQLLELTPAREAAAAHSAAPSSASALPESRAHDLGTAGGTYQFRVFQPTLTVRLRCTLDARGLASCALLRYTGTISTYRILDMICSRPVHTCVRARARDYVFTCMSIRSTNCGCCYDNILVYSN